MTGSQALTTRSESDATAQTEVLAVAKGCNRRAPVEESSRVTQVCGGQ